jgi:proline iminopeptidase
MRVQLLDGTDLWFDTEGLSLVPDGDSMRVRPTLIVMHGGPGGDHNGFKPAFSTMTDTCQVLYYDHRGHGRSGRSGILIDGQMMLSRCVMHSESSSRLYSV